MIYLITPLLRFIMLHIFILLSEIISFYFISENYLLPYDLEYDTTLAPPNTFQFLSLLCKFFINV